MANVTDISVQSPLLPHLFGGDFNVWRLLAGSCVSCWSAASSKTQTLVTIGEHQFDLFEWGSGRFYISLKRPNHSSSYGWKGGSQAVTHWYKLRIDPENLIAHTGDFTPFQGTQ